MIENAPEVGIYYYYYITPNLKLLGNQASSKIWRVDNRGIGDFSLPYPPPQTVRFRFLVPMP